MRTALILLFLLALAAMPGALLPQRSLNSAKTADYIAQHGWWGRLLNKLQFFDVYASVWFSAVYLLLFISLVGCLLPRLFEYLKAVNAKPVLTPRNLKRMPHHVESTVDKAPVEVIADAKVRLRGWRMVVREEDDGGRTLSAEKGFLRETGNLVFHFAMLGLIVALALGKLFGYEGQVIVKADGSQEFCNSGVLGYDSFHPGLRVDGTDLSPFCLKVTSFTPTYLANGQPEKFEADLRYQAGDDIDNGTWRPYTLEVNSPLRTEGDRVYLLGNGYAPVFTVTFPNGEKRTMDTQWRTTDNITYLSEGATKFDPPGITDAQQRRTKQLAITGLFAPTAELRGTLLDSSYPDLRDPAVAVDVLQGDTGVDNGRGQSIFTVDQSLIDDGRLKRVLRTNMRPGEHRTLPDGTDISFDSVKRWVYLQVSHDPGQVWVLVFAICLIVGIGASLTIRRRRLWVRAAPADGGRTVVEVGGLARTDQAGYGEEFTRLSKDVLGGTR
ncbi:cytochrome c biogenesis protein ResB [Actinocrispum wychmicini]|nr:cytochrome c biogenesis protein ResB [Actinocrispum wychmicini]